jgi:hypothetical protein
VAATAAPLANQAAPRTTQEVAAGVAAMKVNAVVAAVPPAQKVVHLQARKVDPGPQAVLHLLVEKASPRVVPQPAGKAGRGVCRQGVKRVAPEVAPTVVLQSPLGQGLPVAPEAAVLSPESLEQVPALLPEARGAEAQRVIARDSRMSRKLGMKDI